MNTVNTAAANYSNPRPARAYNCAFCGAFNRAGALCGCAESRKRAGERVLDSRGMVAAVDAVALVF